MITLRFIYSFNKYLLCLYYVPYTDIRKKTLVEAYITSNYSGSSEEWIEDIAQSLNGVQFVSGTSGLGFGITKEKNSAKLWRGLFLALPPTFLFWWTVNRKAK